MGKTEHNYLGHRNSKPNKKYEQKYDTMFFNNYVHKDIVLTMTNCGVVECIDDGEVDK